MGIQLEGFPVSLLLGCYYFGWSGGFVMLFQKSSFSSSFCAGNGGKSCSI